MPSGLPVAVSHRRAVPSVLAVRMVLPSGLNVARRTDGLAGLRVPETGRLVAAAGHDRGAVRTEQRHIDQAFVRHGLADRLAGGGVPQPGLIVSADGEDGLAIGTEGDAADPFRVD